MTTLLSLLFTIQSSHALYITPAKNGFSPAPIHSDALKVDLRAVAPLPNGHFGALPKIRHGGIYILWDGHTRSRKGHGLPELYASVDFVVSAGEQISGESVKPLESRILNDKNDAFE